MRKPFIQALFLTIIVGFFSSSVAQAGEAEKEIQRQLQTLGYYDSVIDGIWGRGSKQALDVFLNEAGGLHWGDPETREILRKASSSHKAGKGKVASIAVALTSPNTHRPQGTNTPIRIFVQSEHSQRINSGSFSADGRFLATASDDGSVKIWDTKADQELQNFVDNRKRIIAANYDMGREQVVSVDEEKITIWDAASGQKKRSFRAGEYTRFTAAAFSPNGRYIAIGDGAALTIRSTRDGRELFATAELGEVKSLAYSRNGQFLASLSDGDRITVWNTTSGKKLLERKGTDSLIENIAISPNGQHVISVGFHNRYLNMWDVATGQLLRRFATQDNKQPFQAAAFSPDGTKLAGVDSINGLTVWDSATGKLILSIPDERLGDFFSTLEFGPGGQKNFLGTTKGLFEIRSFPSGKKQQKRLVDKHVAHTVFYEPEHNNIVSILDNHTLKAWDTAEAQLAYSLEGASGIIYSADYAPSVAEFATGSKKIVYFWNMSVRKRIGKVELKNGRDCCPEVTAIAFSPDGNKVAIGTGRGDLRLLDTATKSELHHWEGHRGKIKLITYISGGQQILSASSSSGDTKNIKIWDISTRRMLYQFRGSVHNVNSVAYDPSGNLIALVGANRIELINVKTGKELRNFNLGNSTSWFEQATALAFSPEGKRIAVGTNEGHLRIFDTLTGRKLLELAGHSSEIRTVAYRPDGLQIISGSNDSTTRIWDAKTGMEISKIVHFKKGEILAITPEGFFTVSSPNAARNINVVKGIKGYGIENFYDQLYRPDLVAEALKGDPDGKVARAASELSIETLVAQGFPPELKLISPVGGAKLESDKIEIKVGVNELDGGIGRIEFRVNGKVQGSTRGLAPIAASSSSYDKVISQNLLLPPGKSRIEVVAYNEQNTIASNPVSVTVSVDASASRPAELFVLSVGVNDYFDDALDLSYAVSDARAIADFAGRAGQGSYAKVHTKVVTDAEVTQQGLEAVFSEFESQIKPHDAFLFFIAGHGKTVDGRCYFLPQDFRYHNASSITEEGLSQEIWQDWFARIPAQRALLLYDTCESGSMTATQTRGLELKGAIDRFAHATGRAILTASTDNQPALEGYRGHGIFTYALLEAFAEADANSDQTLLTTELATYVDTNLPRLSKEAFGHSQIPQMQLVGNAFPIGTPIAFTPTNQPRIPKEPTHIVIAEIDVLDDNGNNSNLTLEPGTQVRLIEQTDRRAAIAVNGKQIGYVEVSALLKIRN